MTGLMSCASVSTVFDYDKEVDFSRYKTYNFTEDDLTLAVGQFNRERIIKAIETELAAKGLEKVEEGDLLVNAHIKSKEKVEASATTTGGYGPYNVRFGSSTTYIDYNEYTVGSLFITMADASNNSIIWQGAGTKTLDESASADKREQSINYAVQQILKNYPPGE